MQSASKMGLLDGVTVLIETDVDIFFEKINRGILEGRRPIHLYREKIGWWIFGYFRYVALIKKSQKPDIKLKIEIGPVTNRPLPKLILKVGAVSDRRI